MKLGVYRDKGCLETQVDFELVVDDPNEVSVRIRVNGGAVEAPYLVRFREENGKITCFPSMVPNSQFVNRDPNDYTLVTIGDDY